MLGSDIGVGIRKENSMANTRDVRTLGQYMAHFEKYDREVLFESHLRGDEFGVIETRGSGLLYFVPILYQGKQVYSVGIY